MSNQHQSYLTRLANDKSHEMAEKYFRKKQIAYADYGIKSVEFMGNQMALAGLNKLILKTPDFIVLTAPKKFIEVKGCKRVFNLKIDDLKYYHYWNTAFEPMFLEIMVIDFSNNDVYIFPLDHINRLIIENNYVPEPYANDGNLRYKIPLSDWQQYKKEIV